MNWRYAAFILCRKCTSALTLKLAVCAFTGFAAKGWHKQLRLQAHPKTQWEISEAEHHLPVRQVDVCFLILSPARLATSFVWMYGDDSSLKLEEECPIIIIRTLLCEPPAVENWHEDPWVVGISVCSNSNYAFMACLYCYSAENFFDATNVT